MSLSVKTCVFFSNDTCETESFKDKIKFISFVKNYFREKKKKMYLCVSLKTYRIVCDKKKKFLK